MKSKAQISVISIIAVSAALALASTILYIFDENDIWFSISITSGTILYQFLMRLIVGWSVNIGIKKKLDYNNAWFRQKAFEEKAFNVLSVRKWKRKLPTYIPDHFNINNHSLQAIIQNMCIAELGHEIMIAASFLSLFLSLLTNDWKTYIWIFIITSCFAGIGDLLLVIIQRYNRPRAVAILNRRTEKSKQMLEQRLKA